MITLVIILNKEEYLDEVLSTMVRFKVKGATIIDSQGMGSAIVSGDYQHIPLFGALRYLVNEKHPYNKTIFGCKGRNFRRLNNSNSKHFDEKTGIGFMFTVL